MHIAAVETIEHKLLPAVHSLRRYSTRIEAVQRCSHGWRTHLQDATPLTLGQVISGWVAQLDEGR